MAFNPAPFFPQVGWSSLVRRKRGNHQRPPEKRKVQLAGYSFRGSRAQPEAKEEHWPGRPHLEKVIASAGASGKRIRDRQGVSGSCSPSGSLGVEGPGPQALRATASLLLQQPPQPASGSPRDKAFWVSWLLPCTGRAGAQPLGTGRGRGPLRPAFSWRPPCLQVLTQPDPQGYFLTLAAFPTSVGTSRGEGGSHSKLVSAHAFLPRRPPTPMRLRLSISSQPFHLQFKKVGGCCSRCGWAWVWVGGRWSRVLGRRRGRGATGGCGCLWGARACVLGAGRT